MLVPVGNGNLVSAVRVTGVRTSDPEAVRSLKRNRTSAAAIIDACAGRSVRSLIYLDSNQVVISPIGHDRLLNLLTGNRG